MHIVLLEIDGGLNVTLGTCYDTCVPNIGRYKL